MTPERAQLLGELITEMTEVDHGFIPNAAWLPIQRAFNLPYIELVVAKEINGKPHILLDYRKDEYWNGWHIPGGLWRAPWSLRQACLKIAASEKIETIAGGYREIKTHKWMDHPYGNPISHIVVCYAAADIKTIKGQREFFSRPPADIIAHHDTFMNVCIEWINANLADELQNMFSE